MGQVAETIRLKLQEAFAPVRLEVVDQSAKHAGHSGAHEGGESHFDVVIVSPQFQGQGRVARQRAVYGALRTELAGPVHALSLKALTPEE